MMLPFTSQQLFSRKLNAFYFGNKSKRITINDVGIRFEKKGTYVTHVVPGSYAEQKGIKVGDKLKGDDSWIYCCYYHKKTGSKIIYNYTTRGLIQHDFIWFDLQE